jgi:hypothetical protein
MITVILKDMSTTCHPTQTAYSSKHACKYFNQWETIFRSGLEFWNYNFRGLKTHPTEYASSLEDPCRVQSAVVDETTMEY